MTIKNERQYLASLAHRVRLLAARERYEAYPQADSLAQDWLLAGVDRLIADVDAEIAEYTATSQDAPVSTAAMVPREDAWAYTPEHVALVEQARPDAREGKVYQLGRRDLERRIADADGDPLTEKQER